MADFFAALFRGVFASEFFSLSLDFDFVFETGSAFLETAALAEDAAFFEAAFCTARFFEDSFAAELFDFPPITCNYNIGSFFLQAKLAESRGACLLMPKSISSPKADRRVMLTMAL